MGGPSSEGGYTRQYRRLWSHPAFRNKQEAAVFSWLKDAAQWRDLCLQTKYGPVKLRRGEVLIAERELSEDFGLARNTLRSLMERMVTMGMVTLIRDGRAPQRAGTILQICNYDAYQLSGDGASFGTANEAAPGPQEDRGPDRSRTAPGPQKTQDGGVFAPDLVDDQDRNGTAERTENGPQEDRTRTKNKEGKEVKEDREDTGSLRSPAAQPAAEMKAEQSLLPPEHRGLVVVGAAPSSDLLGLLAETKPERPSASQALYREGLAKMVEMTGRQPDRLRAWFGKMLKQTGGNAALILEAVQDAHRRWLVRGDEERADPTAWVAGYVKAKAKPTKAAEREVPEWVGDHRVADLVERIYRITNTDYDGLWDSHDFSLLIADSLTAGKHPDRDIIPMAQRAARRSEGAAGLGLAWWRTALGLKRPDLRLVGSAA